MELASSFPYTAILRDATAGLIINYMRTHTIQAKNSRAKDNSTRLFTALAFVVCLLLLLSPIDASAADAGSEKQRLGWLQSIRLMPHQLRMTAKLDTGAKSNVIHAVDIKEILVNGDTFIRFTVPVISKKHGNTEVMYELPLVRTSRIKQHNSTELDLRPVVEMSFCINKQVYHAQFSLDNREKFNYPVLLGRDFLKQHFVIDPSVTFLKRSSCP